MISKACFNLIIDPNSKTNAAKSVKSKKRLRSRLPNVCCLKTFPEEIFILRLGQTRDQPIKGLADQPDQVSQQSIRKLPTGKTKFRTEKYSFQVLTLSR